MTKFQPLMNDFDDRDALLAFSHKANQLLQAFHDPDHEDGTIISIGEKFVIPRMRNNPLEVINHPEYLDPSILGYDTAFNIIYRKQVSSNKKDDTEGTIYIKPSAIKGRAERPERPEEAIVRVGFWSLPADIRSKVDEEITNRETDTEATGETLSKRFRLVMESCEPKHLLIDELYSSPIYTRLFKPAESIADTYIHDHFPIGGAFLEENQEKSWAAGYYRFYRILFFGTLASILSRYCEYRDQSILYRDASKNDPEIKHLEMFISNCESILSSLDSGIKRLDGLIENKGVISYVLSRESEIASTKLTRLLMDRDEVLKKITDNGQKLPKGIFTRLLTEAFLGSSKSYRNTAALTMNILDKFITQDYGDEFIKDIRGEYKQKNRAPKNENATDFGLPELF